MADSELQPRQHPISPPSHPKQFRAIGVVYGRYYASEESTQRGVLVTETGDIVEAVLLGKTFSLFKRHANLEDPHFWVVYPRLRDKDDHLHFQLAGLWEPENLGPGLTSASSPSPLASPEKERPYFSIRGEVVFVSQARENIVVKVRQSPKPPSKRPLFFKVKISGVLKDAEGEICRRPLRRFWDIEATLQNNELVLENATDLGPLQRRSSPAKPTAKTLPKTKTNGSKPVKKSAISSPKSAPVKRRLF
ncbi:MULTISPECIES: hypothetical protein [unclassified Synechocystis]|uniref:hypothetical protein n=1 Tax=unclassified Synechocystis TaxID=2640012 RepID=UPI000412CBB0|nr:MULTISPECIES: hypothetical protein [unclassified Synechocystis]AIE73309.1 hypothetical protein D082_07800 [Synechocystis sp. PCC 6714]MCT0253129.1 hypothetical protein [Synechocystis sp. CS-94]